MDEPEKEALSGAVGAEHDGALAAIDPHRDLMDESRSARRI